ncbi:MAG: hypothetical protein A2V88_08650 [Elusimicrobia bacterium RBG_16_66_12]|nr:MAG: hypothetical protein A2V88_08650 [Elusimicrobia bacterium RBG_16_66_12]
MSLMAAALTNAHATTIITESDLFEPVRAAARERLPEPWCDLLTCGVCTGTWIGLAQGLLHSRQPARALTYGLAVACLGRAVRALLALAETYAEPSPSP